MEEEAKGRLDWGSEGKGNEDLEKKGKGQYIIGRNCLVGFVIPEVWMPDCVCVCSNEELHNLYRSSNTGFINTLNKIERMKRRRGTQKVEIQEILLAKSAKEDK